MKQFDIDPDTIHELSEKEIDKIIRDNGEDPELLAALGKEAVDKALSQYKALKAIKKKDKR